VLSYLRRSVVCVHVYTYVDMCPWKYIHMFPCVFGYTLIAYAEVSFSLFKHLGDQVCSRVDVL